MINMKTWQARWGVVCMMCIWSGILVLGYQNCSIESDFDTGESGSQRIPSSDDSPGGTIRVPDQFDVVDDLAQDYDEEFEAACQAKENGSWAFLHRVVTTLHKDDARWGYFFKDCSQNQAFDADSRHSIAYYVGSDSNGEGSTLASPIQIIRDYCEDSSEATWETPNSRGCWTYPWSDCTQPPNMEDFVRDFPDNAKTSLDDKTDATYRAYLDELLVELNKQNPFGSWGHFCIGGDCNRIATRRIAYGCEPNLDAQEGESPWERVIPIYVIEDSGDTPDSDWNPRSDEDSTHWQAARASGGGDGASPTPAPSASSSPEDVPPCWASMTRQSCLANNVGGSTHCKWFAAGSKRISSGVRGGPGSESWLTGCYPSCGSLANWRSCSNLNSLGQYKNPCPGGSIDVGMTYEEIDDLRQRTKDWNLRWQCCGRSCTKRLPTNRTYPPQ